MEAALADRGVDYRDRWRVDPVTGRPVLTLRRIAVLTLRHIPDHSPLMEEWLGYRPVTRLEGMVDDVRRAVQMTAGAKDPQMHPDRERALAASRERERIERERIVRERLEKRRRELAAMEGGD